MRIVLASNNKGKLRELGDLLENHSIELIPQGELDIPEAEEDGLSFVENAILKARHACSLSGFPAIADDSGLEVDALKGAPGIHSARYAGVHGDDTANNHKLLEALCNVPNEDRTARFQCVMIFMRHAKDPTPMVCQGSWEGRILREPRGENGFGYDPLFWVPDENATAAELASAVKNAQSHRGKALHKLMRRLTEHG